MQNQVALAGLAQIAAIALERLGTDHAEMRAQIKRVAPNAFTPDSIGDRSPLTAYLLAVLPRRDRTFDPFEDTYQDVAVEHPNDGKSRVRLLRGRLGCDFVDISLPDYLAKFDLSSYDEAEAVA